MGEGVRAYLFYHLRVGKRKGGSDPYIMKKKEKIEGKRT